MTPVTTEPTAAELTTELWERYIESRDATLRDLAEAAKRGDVERFKQAPRLAPRRRLDETKAAREPKLRWRPDQARKEAAE